MRATRIYLIRHGQVANHHEYRYNGHFDVDITSTGVEQMHRVCEFISSREIGAVYSSDLQRTVKGARIIGKKLGVEPVMMRSLRELNLGRWEGLTRAEAVAKYPDDAALQLPGPRYRQDKRGREPSGAARQSLASARGDTREARERGRVRGRARRASTG